MPQILDGQLLALANAILKCEASLSVIYSGRHTRPADQRSQHSHVVLRASHEIKDEDACVGKGASQLSDQSSSFLWQAGIL